MTARASWAVGAVEVPEVPPQRSHPRQRVAVGEFEDDATPGVGLEGGGEGAQVGDVVGDVVAHDDVGVGGAVGDVGPVAEHLVVRKPPAVRGGGEGVEHALLVVDADDDAGGWGDGERGPTAAAADVQQGAAGRQCLAGLGVGGAVRRGGVRGDEQGDGVDPG
jgi:hypothetical protein